MKWLVHQILLAIRGFFCRFQSTLSLNPHDRSGFRTNRKTYGRKQSFNKALFITFLIQQRFINTRLYLGMCSAESVKSEWQMIFLTIDNAESAILGHNLNLEFNLQLCFIYVYNYVMFYFIFYRIVVWWREIAGIDSWIDIFDFLVKNSKNNAFLSSRTVKVLFLTGGVKPFRLFTPAKQFLSVHQKQYTSI